MTLPTYALHGLRIASEVPIPSSAPTDGTPDLEVRLGDETRVGEEAPSGELLALLETAPGRGYSISRTAEGYAIRLFSACDFRLTADLRTATVHPDVALDRAFVPLFVTGQLLGSVLMLGGSCVLHASAVELSGNALAIVGTSGMGKSTLAALFCADGARLVTDDLLRVDLGNGRPKCHLGPSELRLRPGAAALQERFGDAPHWTTADGRLGIRLAGITQSRIALGTILIPHLSRSAPGLTVDRVSPKQSVLRLFTCLRLPGWRAKHELAKQFRWLAEIATRVPVLDAVIPWGPPFPTDLARRLAEIAGRESRNA